MWLFLFQFIFCFTAFVMLLPTESDGFVLYLFQCWPETGASGHPCSEIYHGLAAMSEREVQNVANFLQSQGQRLVGYLDIHSYSQILMFPWGYTKRWNKDYAELVQYKIRLNIFDQFCLGPVHTYPDIFESATFSFRMRLPSTRIRRIRQRIRRK